MDKRYYVAAKARTDQAAQAADAAREQARLLLEQQEAAQEKAKEGQPQ